MRWIGSVVALITLAAPMPALAHGNDCSLTAHIVGGGAQSLYDPFAPLNTVIDLDVDVRNAGDQPCNARLYVAPRDGRLRLSSDGVGLTYRIEGAHTGGSSLPNGYGPFNAHARAHETDTVHIQFTVLAQQIVPRGTYTSDLVLAGIGEGGDPVTIADSGGVLRVEVPSRVDMSISGAAAPSLPTGHMAPASIDFGVAHTGDRGRVFINVWSNGSVTISLDSANHSVLRHIANAALPPIPYSATFDGSPINLASTFAAQRTPPASIVGASYPFVVTLGNVSGKFAGRYRDIVTVNVNQN